MVLSLSSSEDTLAAGAGQWTSAIVEMLIVREVESELAMFQLPTSGLKSSASFVRWFSFFWRLSIRSDVTTTK